MHPQAARKKASGDGTMPVIKCNSCGAEIMLVPNVELMSEAIEAHIEKHRQRTKNTSIIESEAETIRGDLIKQVFDKASQQ